MELDPHVDSLASFKERIQSLTGVPVERQKLLAKKGGWKGILQDDYSFSSLSTTTMVVTLIGSAAVLPQQSATPIKFVEDMTPQELQEQERRMAMRNNDPESDQVIGMIPAIQKPPYERNDNKTEWYAYNHYVSGIPQRHIESLLLEQQQPTKKDDAKADSTSSDTNTSAAAAATTTVLGRVVMGMELRRAYINDLAVLPQNGTLISALDDGHIQFWRHGVLQDDLVHQGHPFFQNSSGGVQSIDVLEDCSANSLSSSSSFSTLFATTGRGTIRLWSYSMNEDTAHEILELASPMPGAASPTSLRHVPLALAVAPNHNNQPETMAPSLVCLAARFESTRLPNPHQFHLAPQTEVERQRRAQAEAQEQALQDQLDRMSKCIQLWFSDVTTSTTSDVSTRPVLRSLVLEARDSEGAAPLTCLTVVPGTAVGEPTWLIAGDVTGGLRFWKVLATDMSLPQNVSSTPASSSVSVQESFYVRLTPETGEGCSIVCLETTMDGDIVVSTNGTGNPNVASSSRGEGQVSVPLGRAVYVLKMAKNVSVDSIERIAVVSTLGGHTKDAVQCMLPLPNGDLLTAGGKYDATVQLWKSAQL